MPAKSKFKSVALFLGGFVTAGILAALLFWSQGVQAYDFSCMRKDLDAKRYSGIFGSATVIIEYQVPQCWFDAGYHVDKVYKSSANCVRVTYKK